MFLTLCSPATCDFRPLTERAVFARLADVCVVACTTLRSKKIVLLKPSLQIVASNQIKETSHKNLNKNAARVPRFHHEKRQMDRKKKIVLP